MKKRLFVSLKTCIVLEVIVKNKKAIKNRDEIFLIFQGNDCFDSLIIEITKKGKQLINSLQRY
ncbi:hypothetical protein THALO_40038 [Tenacibaculum halocynthiae]